MNPFKKGNGTKSAAWALILANVIIGVLRHNDVDVPPGLQETISDALVGVLGWFLGRKVDAAAKDAATAADEAAAAADEVIRARPKRH
jgi:hypothetical protein